MTFILRILSLASAFLMVVFFALPLLMIGHGRSPIRDALASAFLVALGILAMRCTKWLWRRLRFWTEIRSLSEVAAFGSFILIWPLEAFLERRTEGWGKDAVHLATVLLVFSVYIFVQRYGEKRAFQQSSPNPSFQRTASGAR
jgi:hypothetical protein